MQDFLGVKQGEISIGGSTIPGEYILPKVLGSFSKEYPGITVTLTIADSEEIERRVLDGEFELGVIGRKSSNKNLVSHELWKDELVLALHSSHRWAGKKEVSIQEVVQEPFILRELGSGTLKSMEPYLQGAGLEGSLLSARGAAGHFHGGQGGHQVRPWHFYPFFHRPRDRAEGRNPESREA